MYLLRRVIRPWEDLEDTSVDLNRSVWICKPDVWVFQEHGIAYTETIKSN